MEDTKKLHNNCDHEYHDVISKTETWETFYDSYDKEMKAHAILKHDSVIIYCIHCGDSKSIQEYLGINRKD